MDRYQMFFPGSSSSAAAAAPSQLQALVHSKSGTTANLGGEPSTSAIGHGLLGSTLQLTGTENHVTTSNGRHLVGNHSSEAGAANHSDEAADDSSAGKMINKINSKKKLKKPKYAFQTRSQVDILDDGYRWRKYGQKAVKANKFPRSYYRCTYEGCNVKKQVQRLSKDEGVVVTTYEGMHTHPIDKPNSDNFEHILTQMQLTNYTTTPSQPS